MLNKGIILISTGHANYGNMAYNLAITIKGVEPIPIALIHDTTSLGHLNDAQLKAFDFLIEIPETYKKGFGAKLHIDQLTPFDKTLYLDVDMLWLGRKPSELFAELDGTMFSIITEGDSDTPNNKYYFWADAAEIKESYKVDNVLQTRSEVIYFEKGTKVFKKARELKPELKLKTIRMFGEHIPDELYFNIATALLNVKPHKQRWMPAYWSRLNNEIMPNLSVLFQEYYLLSFGSNAASPSMKRSYDNIMQVAFNKLRMPYLFKLKSKKEWAPGRLKI